MQWSILSLIKENSDTVYNTDEPWGHYVDWNNTVAKKTNTVDSIHLRSLPLSKKEIAAPGAGGMEEWGVNV